MTRFEKDITRFMRNALNRTITKCAKIQRDMIREDYAIAPKTLRKLTKIRRAKQESLEASISNAKTQLSLNHFKRIQTKQGVKVKLSKSKTLFLKGAFLGVRAGGQKVDNKSGFLATRHTPTNTQNLAFSQSSIKSHKGHKAPKSSKVYYFKTKALSQLAKEKTKDLQKLAKDVFTQELNKE